MNLSAPLFAALLCCAPLLAHASLGADVIALRSDWEKVKYQLPKDQREVAFADLAARAAKVAANHPGEPEALVWEAIVLASQAGENGGIGALGLVKQARDLLLQAEAIDPQTLGGSVYTSLGSLYYQVPGWPLGFGDDDKARAYLDKALAIDPNGLDANFFYAGFLADQGDYAGALAAYQHALAAPPRLDRPLADSGRRGEIAAQIALLRQQMPN